MAGNDMRWHSVLVDHEGHDLRFSMTIKNFMDYTCKPGGVLQTPPMECSELCGIKWVLQIYAYGASEEKKEHVGIFLKMVEKPADVGLVTASYDLSIVGQDGTKKKIRKLNAMEETLNVGYGFPTFINRGDIQSKAGVYLSNGCLIIHCEGKEYFNRPKQILTVDSIPQTETSNNGLDIVKKLYNENICSDVVLKTGSSEFHCHKAILAAASSYFMGMFGHDMKENKENVVDLSKELKQEELKAVLDYIYLGQRKFTNLPQASLQTLYRMSDVFEIIGLQQASERELINQLNKDNARELMAFAMTYCAKHLEKAAAAVIANGLG